MIRNFLIIFFLLLSLLSCARKQQLQPLTQSINNNILDLNFHSDEYAVISIIVDSLYGSAFEKTRDFSSAMVIESTLVAPTFDGSQHWRNFIDTSTLLRDFEIDSMSIAFQRINRMPTTFHQDSFACKFKVVVMRQTLLDSIMGNPLSPDWHMFYKLYPHTRGFMRSSRVAFNHNHTQAVLYWEREREPLMGVGEFVFLIKRSNKWIIVGIKNIWIS